MIKPTNCTIYFNVISNTVTVSFSAGRKRPDGQWVGKGIRHGEINAADVIVEVNPNDMQQLPDSISGAELIRALYGLFKKLEN